MVVSFMPRFKERKNEPMNRVFEAVRLAAIAGRDRLFRPKAKL